MRNGLLGLILSTHLLTGCAQLEVLEAADQGRAPELVIASDLVNALMQVEGYHPSTTRLQVQKSRHSFGKLLNSVLTSVGYDIEFVDGRKGDRFVDYTLSNHHNSAGTAPKTYHLSVGAVEFKRDYDIVRGRVQPASNLLMAGVDPMTIRLNDQIFGLDSESADVIEQEQAVPVSVSASVEPKPESPESSLQRVKDVAPVNALHASEQHYSAIELLVNGESSPSLYNAGDNMVFTIRTQRDVRLSCYYQDPDGSVIRIYPNRYTSRPMVKAGELVHVPSTNNWALQASRSGATDEVMCLSVEPNFDPIMAAYESTPDLEPLSVNSFEQLLDEINLQTGVAPQVERLSIRVN